MLGHFLDEIKENHLYLKKDWDDSIVLESISLKQKFVILPQLLKWKKFNEAFFKRANVGSLLVKVEYVRDVYNEYVKEVLGEE